MIPTKTIVNDLLTSLPIRATDSSVENQVNIMGGCKDYYRCWGKTYYGLFRSHDRVLGHVEIERGKSSDGHARHLCKLKFTKHNDNYSHTQWMGCRQ